jgi:hypothetical protein
VSPSRWLPIPFAAVFFACAPAAPAPEAPPAEVVVMTAAPVGPVSTGAARALEAAPERVLVELFVMSRCPYANRVEITWAEAARRLGNVDLRVSFIGTVDPDGKLRSMRGPSELTGDAAQICAMTYSPKWFEMIMCQSRTFNDADFNWRECAADLGMPLSSIEVCTFGGEGQALLAESFAHATSRQANASPTMFIADRKYNGGRSLKELISAVCAASSTKPDVCSTLDTPAVPVTAIMDRRCSTCDTPRAENHALAPLLNPKLTVLDYQSPAGRTLFDSTKHAELPLYVFDSALETDASASAALAPRLKTENLARVLDDGTWNPRCADSCAAPNCKAAPPCRASRPKHVELYLEDSSTLSTPAVLALREVLENFEANKNPIGFSVQHLVQDPKRNAPAASDAAGAESIRRACVQKLAPGKPLMRYLICRAGAQAGDDWAGCAGGATGVDAKAVGKCADGSEGKKLLEASRKRAREGQVTSGATFLVNGQVSIRTVHAEALKKAVCSANPKLGGCDVVLGSLLLK